MANNIIDTIKNNDNILELFNRSILINEKIINLNKKNKLKIIIINSIVFILSYINYFYVLNNEVDSLEVSTFVEIFVIFCLPIIASLLFTFFSYVIIDVIRGVMILINYKNKIIRNFEKSLNDKDLELYKNYNFHKRGDSYYNNNDFQYLLYDIYLNNLKNIEIETLHKNKNLIIENIKTKFNVSNQKKLLNVIADILDKNILDNNINKEIERINTSFEKLELKKFNNINVENI